MTPRERVQLGVVALPAAGRIELTPELAALVDGGAVVALRTDTQSLLIQWSRWLRFPCELPAGEHELRVIEGDGAQRRIELRVEPGETILLDAGER